MTETNQDITIYRGDTCTIGVTLTNVDGSPFIPTDELTVKWRLMLNSDEIEDNALVRKSLGQGISQTEEGVNISLTSADTDQPPRLYYHELKVVDGPDVMTAMVGVVQIKPSARMGDAAAAAAVALTLTTSAPMVAR